eukprot:gene25311-10966_t
MILLFLLQLALLTTVQSEGSTSSLLIPTLGFQPNPPGGQYLIPTTPPGPIIPVTLPGPPSYPPSPPQLPSQILDPSIPVTLPGPPSYPPSPPQLPSQISAPSNPVTLPGPPSYPPSPLQLPSQIPKPSIPVTLPGPPSYPPSPPQLPSQIPDPSTPVTLLGPPSYPPIPPQVPSQIPDPSTPVTLPAPSSYSTSSPQVPSQIPDPSTPVTVSIHSPKPLQPIQASLLQNFLTLLISSNTLAHLPCESSGGVVCLTQSTRGAVAVKATLRGSETASNYETLVRSHKTLLLQLCEITCGTAVAVTKDGKVSLLDVGTSCIPDQDPGGIASLPLERTEIFVSIPFQGPPRPQAPIGGDPPEAERQLFFQLTSTFGPGYFQRTDNVGHAPLLTLGGPNTFVALKTPIHLLGALRALTSVMRWSSS